MKVLSFLLAMLVAITFLPFAGFAQKANIEADQGTSTEGEYDKWVAETTTYMWLPTSMKLAPTVSGMGPSQPIKTDIFELIDELGLFDGVYAFSQHFEMWKKWGILWNLDWMKIEGATTKGPVSASLKFQTLVIDTALGYELGKIALSDSNPDNFLRFIGWAGIQYNYLEEDMSISLVPNRLPPPGKRIDLGRSANWFEPIVGLGARFQLNKKLAFGIRAQTGSFGLANCTDENWWVIGGLDYRFSERWSAKVAYKYWKFSYTDGDGAYRLGLDQVIQGPWIGLTFHM